MARPPIPPQKPPPKLGDPTLSRAVDGLHQRIKELEDRSDLSGSVASSIAANGTGRHLATQALSGSGAYVPTAGTRRIWLQMVGAGGGGGDANGGVSTAACGSGGGSGVWGEAWIDPGTAITGGLYSCGTPGANNFSGGDTSITVNGKLYSVSGGGGGQAMTAGSSVLIAGNNLAPGVTQNMDRFTNEQGALGFRLSATIFASGQGGSSPWGHGGDSLVGAGATGINAKGYGGGGGGATATASTKNGGIGSMGWIVIHEFS